MRITFQSQGGIAFFPKLNRPVVIDTAQLPAAERSKLEGLLQSTRFFALPPSIGQRRRGAADLREYTLRVEDETRDYTVRVVEPFDHPELEQLIAELRSHARVQAAKNP
jgi:hypothetical protein